MRTDSPFQELTVYEMSAFLFRKEHCQECVVKVGRSLNFHLYFFACVFIVWYVL